MSRSSVFRSQEPLRHRLDLSLQDDSARGPCSFLNPTRAKFHFSPDKSPSGSYYYWRSRDNRKGRHPLHIADDADGKKGLDLPQKTSSPQAVLKGVIRMFTTFPIWDISWCVAFIFTLGSCVWSINGCYSWFPLVAPSTEFNNEIYVGGGVTAFIGAIVFFETGSILLMVEAINENNSGCFGWAVEQLYSDAGSARLVQRKDHCSHHHQNKRNFVGRGSGGSESSEKYRQDPYGRNRTWQWFPSLRSLREHYFHEIGFLASFFQFLGATIFGISGFTALPGIYNKIESNQGLLDGIYWVPQVVGGSGFIISSTLYMLETQEKWWKPNFSVLGWHIGFWNLIGAIGFTLCGALGMGSNSNSGVAYQTALSTFWGSWAFLVGSLIQLYESLEKFPVESG